MRRLEGRVAVVTGAGVGIGRPLASRGASVSTHDVDISDGAQVESFAGALEERHGRADVLINNAGVALHGTVEEVSLADIEWVMSVNFWGTVYCVKHFLPLLRRQTSAHIVCVSSIFGVIAPPGQAAYCASK